MTWHYCNTATTRCRIRPTLAATSSQVRLNIDKEKTKIRRMNTTSVEPIPLKGSRIEIDYFTYLGSIIDKQRGTVADVKARVGRARTVFFTAQKHLALWIGTATNKNKNLLLQCKISAALCKEND